jgi:hypothetical protein
VAFWLWAGLYFTTPVLVFAVWWANRRRDVPATTEDLLIPVRVSHVIAVLGGLSVLTALSLFPFPGRAAAIWLWTLTPLTARVMGAIFALGSQGQAWWPRPGELFLEGLEHAIGPHSRTCARPEHQGWSGPETHSAPDCACSKHC